MRSVPQNATDVRGAAIDYVAAGWRVFPVNSETKRPRIKGWPDAATSDPLVARYWFGRSFPGAAIGLVTGDGLHVVDIDPRKGGSRAPDWPETLTVRTPSGGLHLYFRTDEALRNSVDKVAKGVDTRGERGYVLAPPSPGYSFVNDLPLAVLPASIARAVGARRVRTVAAGGARGRWRPPAGWAPFAPAAQPVGDGGRHDYLVRFAGWLLYVGVAAADLYEELETENERVCVPMFDDDEVDAIAASFGMYADRTEAA